MNIIDRETKLEVGDPDRLPFGKKIDLVRLQGNIEKRLRFGIASASGIRQIFDQTYGDEKTSYEDGTGTEITDAAKIHVATIADCFVELLRERTEKPYLTIVIAIDSRHTGPAIADIVIRILVFHGVNVRYTFITPITELAVYSREVSDGFVYISASHNPRGYNGLKLGLNDGRLLPGHLARAFIEKYQSRLKDQENTRAMIHRVNSADTDKVHDVYNEIELYRKESRRIYANSSDRMITGIRDPQEASKQKSLLREEILRRDMWIGLDPNGGARKDKEYLEGWGFHVLEINGCPRVDMVHDLSPVPSACEQARESLINLQHEGKNAIAFFVFDADGDRKSVVIPDGKGSAVAPGVQMIFALDVVCRILDSGERKHLNIAVVVNDATSSIMEQLAYYLDFSLKRVEVGEANVATAGIDLNEQGIYVPIMGEGSNGGVFDLDLLVREPLHTIRTIINLTTKPELTNLLLERFSQMVGNPSSVTCCPLLATDDWHSPEKMTGLLMNIINVLPPSRTTDFFTDEGVRRGGHDLPQELFKANFDAYFESHLWHGIADEIKRNYGAEPIAEFVNYEGVMELRGRGARKTGTGGYKVEFYIQTPDNKKRNIGWLWFRSSATEPGVMRKGVSISHWEMIPQAVSVVNRVYEYIDKAFNAALSAVEEKTLI